MEENDSTVCNIADLHRRNNKAVDYYIHWGTCDTCHKKDQYPLCTIFDTFPEQTVR